MATEAEITIEARPLYMVIETKLPDGKWEASIQVWNDDEEEGDEQLRYNAHDLSFRFRVATQVAVWLYCIFKALKHKVRETGNDG